MIYTKDKAKNKLFINIDSRVEKISGYFKDSDYWIAYDNTSNEMFVEEFKEEKHAIGWLAGFDFVFDEQISIRQIFSGVYYIPKYGFFKTIIQDDIMTIRTYTCGFNNLAKKCLLIICNKFKYSVL